MTNLPNKTSEELFKESINALPIYSQVIIKAYATKQSLDFQDFNPLLWLATALAWWNVVKEQFEKVGITEEETAKLIINRLRAEQPIWNKLFSEDPLLAEDKIN